LLARLDRRAQALVAEVGRKTNVDHGDLWLVRVDLAQQRVSVAHGRDDLEAVVAQEALQAVAQEREVLGDHYPHGMSALISVGPPSGLATRSVPSSASIRRRRPLRPLPFGFAPPMPSSATSTVSMSPSRRMRMSTRFACECLLAFASASATTK